MRFAHRAAAAAVSYHAIAWSSGRGHACRFAFASASAAPAGGSSGDDRRGPPPLCATPSSFSTSSSCAAPPDAATTAAVAAYAAGGPLHRFVPDGQYCVLCFLHLFQRTSGREGVVTHQRTPRLISTRRGCISARRG